MLHYPEKKKINSVPEENKFIQGKMAQDRGGKVLVVL